MLASLPDTDSFVEAVKNAPERLRSPDEQARLDRLLACGLARLLAGSEAMSPALPPTRGQVDSALDFLAPAQTDEELGWFGPYRVLKILGKGGMGLVVEAEDPRVARRVAIKTVGKELAHDPQYRDRFLREARLAACFSTITFFQSTTSAKKCPPLFRHALGAGKRLWISGWSKRNPCWRGKSFVWG